MANTDNLKPFKPGQSGNPKGRPKGSRNLLCEQFFKDLRAAWQKGGKEALATMLEESPADFVKVVAGLMPKNIDVDLTDTKTFVILNAPREKDSEAWAQQYGPDNGKQETLQ